MFDRLIDIQPTARDYSAVLAGRRVPNEWRRLTVVDLGALPLDFTFQGCAYEVQQAGYGLAAVFGHNRPQNLSSVELDYREEPAAIKAYILALGTPGSPESGNIGGTIRAIWTPPGAGRVVGLFGMTLRRLEGDDEFGNPRTEPLVAFRLSLPIGRADLSPEILGLWDGLKRYWREPIGD